MQTFLPLPDVEASIRCLDHARLGKQRVEAYQIRRVLVGITPDARYRNHPAVLMWEGYVNALTHYMNLCIVEWKRRGMFNGMLIYPTFKPVVMPPWFGNETFHASHRSNLLRKDELYYRQFGWVEQTILPYVWPYRKSH